MRESLDITHLRIKAMIKSRLILTNQEKSDIIFCCFCTTTRKRDLKRTILQFNKVCISRKADNYCHFLSPQHPFVTQLLTRKLMIELLDMANNPDLHHPSSPEENEEVRVRRVGITVII